MIVLVVAEKGGTGKSIVASNIAMYLVRQNIDVVLVDTDGQATCARFSERRDEAGIGPAMPCIQRTGDVAATLCDLSRHCQVIVVDVGGRDSREMRSAMTVSDLLLVPTCASQTDLKTLSKVSELVSPIRGPNPDLKAFAVLSMTLSSPTIREVDDAREALSQFDQLGFADTIIRDRKVYHDALLNGNGVVELGNFQACTKIQLLAQGSLEITAQARVFK